MRRGAAFAALALLAGCAAAETPAQYQARLRQSCTDAGFIEGSESYRLCLLLQDNNARLDALESRLRFIEQDTRFSGPRGYGGWW